MKFTNLSIPSVILIEPSIHGDSRGYFLETYRHDLFKEFVQSKISFVQDNESKSSKGVIRGLHFQKPPFEQSKLIRVLRGSILDIAVDLRENSPTFLQHRSMSLSEKNFKQVFVPVGFAHGFLTLEDDCEISYKVSNPYDHDSDVSLSVFDKELNIELPCKREAITLSEKDAQGENIKSLSKIF